MTPIVFTDLDGTLLDHDRYSYAQARPTLDRLHRHDVPLILASSKTALEMVPLRRDLGRVDCPMICENGAGLVPGGDEAATAPGAYPTLRQVLGGVPSSLRASFEGFGDMEATRIAQVTGLPLAQAERAAARQFSEPGLFTGTDAQRAAFLEALHAHGVVARQGGRFLTLSFGATKADWMQQICAELTCDTIIALGDAPNDVEMLEAADYAIVLPNAQGHPVHIEVGSSGPKVIRASKAGPAGWDQSLGEVLTLIGVAA